VVLAVLAQVRAVGINDNSRVVNRVLHGSGRRNVYF
jgi:hypothetical protein